MKRVFFALFLWLVLMIVMGALLWSTSLPKSMTGGEKVHVYLHSFQLIQVSSVGLLEMEAADPGPFIFKGPTGFVEGKYTDKPFGAGEGGFYIIPRQVITQGTWILEKGEVEIYLYGKNITGQIESPLQPKTILSAIAFGMITLFLVLYYSRNVE